MVSVLSPSLNCQLLAARGVGLVPVISQCTRLSLPQKRTPADQSPGPVNPRRMVPPYRPISCTGLMTSGSSPIRSLTDGSLPAFTSSASCGASLKVLGNLARSVTVVGPSSLPISCPPIFGAGPGATGVWATAETAGCQGKSNRAERLIPATPALRNKSRRDSLCCNHPLRLSPWSMTTSFGHSVNLPRGEPPKHCLAF